MTNLRVIHMLALLSLVAAGPAANAEEKWRLGFRAGMNSGTLHFSGDLPAHETSRTTPTGQLFLERRLSDALSLESGLQYTRREGSFDTDALVAGGDPGGPVEPHHATIHSDVVVRTLEIPLLVRFAFARGPLRPYVSAGAGVGIFLSSDYTTTIPFSPSQIVTYRSSRDPTFRNLSLGLNVGAGLVHRLADGTSLHLDARYEHGLTNLLHENQYTAGVRLRPNDVKVLAGVSVAL